MGGDLRTETHGIRTWEHDESVCRPAILARHPRTNLRHYDTLAATMAG
ncbi:hypothetical protein [Nocardia cyriacigeorgica]|nr:hypothetical protein [Nocardia cyriacigeorgica]MBF6426745.1 hypothetical protein [Nocardia cyriacigeorgica]BDU05788.1 hypothetical protein FMUBM48_20510 [Nocardia cyriacigeorgica]